MKRVLFTICCVVLIANFANAVPTNVDFQDGPQDPLLVPPMVHELGIGVNGSSGQQGPFPANEEIDAYDEETEITSCTEPPYDDPQIPNVLVTMTNLTHVDWQEVWYVADPETTLTNYDGWVNGELAFKIDSVGVNKPLVYESIIPDNIFQAGEVWEFIIQDYQNAAGGPASALDSIGVPSPGYPPSTGSIIAIPEPVTMMLLLAGVPGLVRRKK